VNVSSTNLNGPSAGKIDARTLKVNGAAFTGDGVPMQAHTYPGMGTQDYADAWSMTIPAVVAGAYSGTATYLAIAN
jgi:hypothetical protein